MPTAKAVPPGSTIQGLRTDAWRAEGARYNAARRLKRRDLFATISLSLFSATGVGLAVVQRIYSFKSGTPADNYITALAVCLGIFLLVVALVEWGAGNSVKSDRLHQNAEELNSFQRKLGLVVSEVNAGKQLNSEEVHKYLQEYEEIKGRNPFNHEPLDDCLFVALQRHAEEFKTAAGKPPYCWLEERWFIARSIFSSIWYFVALWLIIGYLIYTIPWAPAT